MFRMATFAATYHNVKLRAGYAERVSFLLDGAGKIAQVYPGVDPGVHAREVLEAAAKL